MAIFMRRLTGIKISRKYECNILERITGDLLIITYNKNPAYILLPGV
jgi:hypothetical protein